MKAYATSDSLGIFEVDCSDDDSVELCRQARVDGVPDLRYGDPTDIRNLKSYDVFATKYEQLEEFVKKIRPLCSPRHLDFCDETEKATINEFRAKGAIALKKRVLELEREFAEKWDRLDKRKADRKKRENDFRTRNAEFKKKTTEGKPEDIERIAEELNKEKEKLDKEKESLLEELRNFDVEVADISSAKKEQGFRLMKLVLLDLEKKSKKTAGRTQSGEL